VAGKAGRKLLKIVGLKMLQFDPKMPFFRQVSTGKGLAKVGKTLGHVTHVRVMRRRAQESRQEHLIEKGR
jgi:hypothetical protein